MHLQLILGQGTVKIFKVGKLDYKNCVFGTTVPTGASSNFGRIKNNLLYLGADMDSLNCLDASPITTKLGLNNLDSPFTEIFWLLNNYINSVVPTNSGHQREAFEVIYQHLNNAIQSSIVGLQALGKAIGALNEAGLNNTECTSDLGNFVSFTGNLLEALDAFRSQIKLSIDKCQ